MSGMVPCKWCGREDCLGCFPREVEMSDWVPGPTYPTVERMMDEMGATDSDKIEVRKFAEILRRKGGKSDGKTPLPMTTEQRDWLTGDKRP